MPLIYSTFYLKSNTPGVHTNAFWKYLKKTTIEKQELKNRHHAKKGLKKLILTEF